MFAQLFELKLAAAQASGHMRLMARVYDGGDYAASKLPPRPAFDEPSHPYWDSVDRARVSVLKLADFCSEFVIDPTEDPLFSTLEFKDCFNARMEARRVVVCLQLSPADIFDAYEKGYTLKYNGWTLRRGIAVEGTDDYGVPCLTAPMRCTNAAGLVTKVQAPKAPRELARQVWELCTGQQADPASDGLGIDPDPYWP